ncbi:hypothetical protein PQX77_009186 [Marasmius sp. AFHP31]|nr:hypothetical protein PQX77_009186 [Marasmius sp. AFHP31]
MAVVQLVLVNGFNANGQAPPFDLTPVVVISAGISSSLALTRAQLAKLSTDSFGEGLAVSDIQFDLNIPKSSPSPHSVVDICNSSEAVGSASPHSLEIRATGRSSLISPDPNRSRDERTPSPS